jgi:unsaturated rhamnogalacturonyl hydrolase
METHQVRQGIVLSFVWLALAVVPICAADLPSTRQILSDMSLANQYFMDKWPDPGAPIVTDRERPSNIWTRATYSEGLMALFEVDPNAYYYDYLVQWGQAHDWAPAYGSTRDRNADD